VTALAASKPTIDRRSDPHAAATCGQKVLEYRSYIATTSGLALDGDSVGSFIIDAAVTRIPNYESYLTEMRSRAASVGAVGKSTMTDVQEITRTEVLAQSALDDVDADIRHAVDGGPGGDAMRRRRGTSRCRRSRAPSRRWQICARQCHQRQHQRSA